MESGEEVWWDVIDTIWERRSIAHRSAIMSMRDEEELLEYLPGLRRVEA